MLKIQKLEIRNHSKASEKYIDVIFKYSNGFSYEISVPIEYRRTGTEIDEDGIDEYLEKIYNEVNSSNWGKWKAEQEIFWSTEKPGATVTRSFFDILSKKFNWCCATCDLPANPNFARRIQDLKEYGYTLATNTKRHCPKCKKNTTQLILLPIRRGGVTGYETWSPAIRNKIIDVLKSFDAFEAKIGRKEGLLPDHKFPEIRWDSETRRDSLEHLTEKDIKEDFQLLSNQRNQQKREVCRTCFQTGNRGVIYGIPFFYKGTSKWSSTIPKIGKSAEAGCIGCGWYDINQWREKLSEKF
jgi:hypothetical protein